MRVPPLPYPYESPNPRLAVQFVVELVGPKPMPGLKARGVFSHPWFETLGRPMVYTMAPSDSTWRPLGPSDGSPVYDSFALAWPFFDRRGRLSARSAERLFHATERFASGLDRVAMPLTPPENLDERIQALEEARSSLDATVSVTVRPVTGWFDRRALSHALQGIGFSAEGYRFVLTTPDWPEALLEAHALADPPAGPDAIQALDVGFRVARNPVPQWSLEALFETVDACGSLSRSIAIDEDGNHVDGARRAWMEQQLALLVRTLEQRGLPAGSPEARMVFLD